MHDWRDTHPGYYPGREADYIQRAFRQVTRERDPAHPDVIPIAEVYRRSGRPVPAWLTMTALPGGRAS